MIESAGELPDFQETYGLYDGRRPDVPEDEIPQEKLEFQDREAAQAKMNEFAAECAGKFPSLDESSFEGETSSIGDFKRTNMKFAEQILDPSIPLRIVAYKDFVEDGGVKSERIRFMLDKGREDQLVAVVQGVDHGEKGFDINHRFVGPQYRSGQGIGSMILDCAGSFAESSATEKQEDVNLFADAAQLDVIYWFWKNDYRPEGKEDWEGLDMIVNGDESLCLDGRFYVFDKVVEGDDRYERGRDGEVLMENGVKSIDPKKAFGINMVKTFKPGASVKAEKVRVDVKNELSGV